MQTLLEWLKVLGVIFVAILLGELPIVKDAFQVIDQQRAWLLPLTIGLAVVGFLMLLWGWVSVGLLLGQPMTHEEVEQLAARTQILGPGKRFTKARLWGKTSGVQVPDMAWTFQEMKAAWHTGTWWSDPDMRRKYIITAGGTLSVLSGFALFMVIVELPPMKLVLAGSVLYALVRLTWAFWHV